MAYATQDGRVIRVLKQPSTKKLARNAYRKFGASLLEIGQRLYSDPKYAEWFNAVIDATRSKHTNPEHPRVYRKMLGVSPRNQRRMDKAFKRTVREAQLRDDPFDVELSDEGRVCFGGRC